MTYNPGPQPGINALNGQFGTVANSTTLAAALNYGWANSVPIWLPPMVWNFDADVTLTKPNNHAQLRVYGGSFREAVTVTGGTVLNFGSGVVNGLTIDGGSAAINLLLDGVTFAMNSYGNNGLKILNGQEWQVQNCAFQGYSKANANAIAAISTGGFTGAGYIIGNRFETGVNCVFLGAGTNNNNATLIEKNIFSDSARGVLYGTSAVGDQIQLLSIIDNIFENNTIDVETNGTLETFIYERNYTEYNTSNANPRIKINAPHSTNSAVTIRDSFFQHVLPNAGNSVIYINQADGIRVDGNVHINGGYTADRWFCDVSVGGCTRYDIDVAVNQAGVNPLQNKFAAGPQSTRTISNALVVG